MAIEIARCPENPIVWPGKWDWRMSNAYNPTVIFGEGRFCLYGRTAGSLRPQQCYVGRLEGEEGIHTRHLTDEPVLTPEMRKQAVTNSVCYNSVRSSAAIASQSWAWPRASAVCAASACSEASVFLICCPTISSNQRELATNS